MPSSCSASAQPQPPRPNSRANASLLQREGINRVVPSREVDAALPAKHRLSEIVPGNHHYVLLAIHSVGDGADGYGSAEDGFPELLACGGIEGAEPAIDVSVEDQASGSREQSAGAGGVLDVKLQHLAGRKVYLGDSGDRIDVGALAQHPVPVSTGARPGHV